jgi:hypothetical protein
MATTGTCITYEVPNVRIAPSTTDCGCLVCQACGDAFLENGECGVCGARVSEGDRWEEGDNDSPQGARGRVGPVPCPPCGKTSRQS